MHGTLIISVDMDDWYHAGWLAGRSASLFKSSNEAKKYGGEGLEKPVKFILKTFNDLNVNATFFIQGEVALEYPQLVEAIVEEGHEIASHDMHHISPRIRTIKEFERDVKESKNILEKISKDKVVGYRSPNLEFKTEHINKLENLGFVYDSSVYPCIYIPGYYGYMFAPTQPYHPSEKDFTKRGPKRNFWEFPLAVVPKLRLPGGSSWYLRNLGYQIVRQAITAQLKRGCACFFFHPYELSTKLPRIGNTPRHMFNNTGKEFERRLFSLLKNFVGKAHTLSYRSYLGEIGHA